MCIECWWDCLSKMQQISVGIGSFVIIGLMLTWGSLVLEKCFVRPRMWPKGIDWLAAVSVAIFSVFVAGVIVYGLYGAVVCLF